MKTLIQNYCNYALNTLGRSQEVVNHHYYNLLQFSEWIKVRKGFSIVIEQIELKDCFDYLAYYRITPIQNGPNKGKLPSQNTICEKSKSLRKFFEYLKIIGLNTLNREAIPKLNKDRKTIDMAKRGEYQVFRQAPFRYEKKEILAIRNQLLIDIPYLTGLRRSEILRCTFEHFRSPNRQFDILGKGGYIDAVFFTEDLRQKVLDYEQKLKEYTQLRPLNTDLIFVGLDNNNRGKKLNEKYVNRIFQKYSKNLIQDGKITRSLTPHMSRHSFATNCVFSGLSQQATTKLMRHRDPKTTTRYYHLNNEWLRGEYDKIS